MFLRTLSRIRIPFAFVGILAFLFLAFQYLGEESLRTFHEKFSKLKKDYLDDKIRVSDIQKINSHYKHWSSNKEKSHSRSTTSPSKSTISKLNTTPLTAFVTPKIYQPKCRIPHYDAFDPKLDKYFEKKKQNRTLPYTDLMYIDYDGFLHKNETAISVSGLKNLKCMHALYLDKAFGKNIEFKKPIYMTNDFVRVECRNKTNSIVYSSLLTHISDKPNLQKKSYQKETNEILSVYVLGIDATSSLIAERKFPKTLKFIQNELKMYTLKSHTKVGHNTFPNLVGMMSSMKPYTEGKPKLVPFIHYDFSKNGSVTMVAEDGGPAYTTIDRSSFKDNWSPTHYLWDSRKIRRNQYRDYLIKEGFIKKAVSEHNNYINYEYILTLEYLKRFMKSYNSKRKYGYSWVTMLTHDYLSNVQDGDDLEFLSFFKWVKKHQDTFLRNSIIFFISDHGHRYDSIGYTQEGIISNLMPMFFFYLPEHIKKKYPHIHNNLLANANQFTTHFDIYETFKDILKGDFKQKPEPSPNKTRGISIFRRIPERSCKDVQTLIEYCPCFMANYKQLPINDSRVIKAAEFGVEKLNKILESTDKCRKLIFKSVREAKNANSYYNRDLTDKSILMVILFTTTPGNGIFEGTIDLKNGKYELQGKVLRTDKYGNQSHCVQNSRELKPICYCKYQLEEKSSTKGRKA